MNLSHNIKRIAKSLNPASKQSIGPAIASHLESTDHWMTIANFRGCKLWAGPDNKIEKKILWRGDNYDLLNFEVIHELVFPGSICFDIGANIGVYSLIFSKLSGGSCNVHSFEPVNHIRDKLVANARLNGYDGLNVNDFALGEAATTIDMYQVKEGVFRSGTSSFLKNEAVDAIGPDNFEVKPVSVSTLDNYVKERAISRIDFIKIDVEGFEWNVLQGAVNSVEQLRPSILMEYDDIRHKPVSSEMRNFFERARYTVYEVARVGGKVCYLPWDFSKNPRCRNILCKAR